MVKDVLIAARPDQSLQIYNAMLKQHKLTFDFLSFKVFPTWLKKIWNHKKLVVVGDNAHISYWGTFVHMASKRYHLWFAKNWSDRNILDRKSRKLISVNNYKICHYWAEHAGASFKEYSSRNRSAFVIADIHMPHPAVVFKEMVPVYQQHSIDPASTYLYSIKESHSDYADDVENILVPSTYVADTYRQIFKGKKYYIVPYGISVSPLYKKKTYKQIRDFAYIGTVSLEKGSDIVLEYFSKHPEFHIHMFGAIIPEQEYLFSKYQHLENVHLYGQVAKSDLPSMICKFDAGIHMSRFDAYSLGVGEMIGCGLPVIVSEKTGNSDDIRRFDLGLVSSLDIESLAGAIEQLTTQECYSRVIESIDNYIKSGVKDFGTMMVDFYQDVIDGNSERYSYETVKNDKIK